MATLTGWFVITDMTNKLTRFKIDMCITIRALWYSRQATQSSERFSTCGTSSSTLGCEHFGITSYHTLMNAM